MPSPEDYDTWQAVKYTQPYSLARRLWGGLQSATGRRWLMLLTTGALVTAIGALLLRVFRQHPEAVHAYVRNGPDWLRYASAFLVTLGVAVVLFRLINPRLAHGQFFWRYPPGWVAWLAALVVIACIDLSGGLGSDGYSVALWEWLTYPTLAISLVAGYRKLTAEPDTNDGAADRPGSARERPTSVAISQRDDVVCEESMAAAAERRCLPLTLETLASNWSAFEKWLEDDSAAVDDFIGNKRVALRLARYLIAKGGTVGLVGPFGSGKTSVIEWLKGYVQEIKGVEFRHEPDLWFCDVSCWGFEDTSAAITQVLSKAVSAVGEKVDCFSIRHLPETYRKTFAAGGDWVGTLLDLVVGTADPLAQFQALSEILKVVNARLVVVVEDLDRTTSSRFDQREMAALLYRLQRTDNVSFVLAADRTLSGEIDFAKVCDQIEQVREFGPEQVAVLLEAFRNHCRTSHTFPHVATYDEQSPWSRPLFHFHAGEHQHISPAQAAARLLRTPRRVKQVLIHTYRAWRDLHGEIDFDHLLALNMLRHGASQAFNYVFRHWALLSREPQQPADGRDHTPSIRARYQAEWNKVTEQVDWDTDAALALISFLLPLSGEYLRQGKAYHPQPIQGIGHKRYWDRGVNQYVDSDHERDQTVLADICSWLNEKKPDLVTGLVKGGDYVRVFDHYSATSFMHTPHTALDLATTVFDEFRKTPGRLVVDDDPPAAFMALGRLTRGRIEPITEGVGRTWLKAQIAASLPVSLAFANEIYSYWTVVGSALSRLESKREVRHHTVAAARKHWRTADDLLGVLHPRNPFDVYRFVFPPSELEYGGYIYAPEEFRWLGRLLVGALEKESDLVARKITHLIALREEGSRPAEWIYQADLDKLLAIFGADAWEVLDTIQKLAGSVEEMDKSMFTQIAQSGLSMLAVFWLRGGLGDGPLPK